MLAKRDASDENNDGVTNSQNDNRLQIVRRASTYMASLALIIPKAVIPEHELRGDVFEARISRASKPAREYTVYMTHKPGVKKAYLPIRHVGAKLGEEFFVRPPKKYEKADFARDYNEAKPKGLENTSLHWDGKRLALKVGESELELKDVTLRAQEGKAVLDATLNDEDKNAVKIAKGVDGFDFRFVRDHAQVISIRETVEGLAIEYRRTQHDEFPHIRLMKVERQQTETERIESWKHGVKLGHEGKLERAVAMSKDSIRIEFSDENRRKAWEYWSSAASSSERIYHQGDIGEEVVRIALEKSGFKTFPKEIFVPANKRRYAHESEMPGPDIVLYGNVGGNEGYHVCEVKHWREPTKALKEARGDAVDFRDSHINRPLLEQTLGSKILGSFVIELDWSYKDPVGVIYSEYMEY